MANKIYRALETAITWAPSGGSAVMDLVSLAVGAGRDGARHDFGSGSVSRWYNWRFFCQFETPPVINERVRIYWKSSDGTHPDNDEGTGDTVVSAEAKLNNLQFLGALLVDQAAADIEMVASGLLVVETRYGNPVIWNEAADILHDTNTLSGFTLTAVPPEVQ